MHPPPLVAVAAALMASLSFVAPLSAQPTSEVEPAPPTGGVPESSEPANEGQSVADDATAKPPAEPEMGAADDDDSVSAVAAAPPPAAPDPEPERSASREAPPMAAPIAPEPASEVAEVEARTYPRFEPSLRLMTGFERTSETRFGALTNVKVERYGFFLSQARAQLQGKLTKRVELELSAELSDAYDASVVTSANKPPYLRDAFMNLRLLREFQITLGHFKRPMSALEHRNAGKLQVRGRGITNDLILEDNAWGSRGLGAQLWGKFKAIDLTWAVGAFDPGWAASAAARPKGVDLLARLSIELFDSLEIGVNGGMKTLDTPPFDRYDTYYAMGADIELDIAGLNFLVDGLYAQLPQVAAGLDEQTAAGVVGILSYDFAITPEFTLQPVVLGEYSDASVDHDLSETVRGVAGLNGIFYETLRVMPQAEVVRWLDDPSELSPREGTAFYVMVSLAM